MMANKRRINSYEPLKSSRSNDLFKFQLMNVYTDFCYRQIHSQNNLFLSQYARRHAIDVFGYCFYYRSLSYMIFFFHFWPLNTFTTSLSVVYILIPLLSLFFAQSL